MSGFRPITSESAPWKPTKRNVMSLSMDSTSPPSTADAGVTFGEPSSLTIVEMTRPSTGIARPRAKNESQLESTAHQIEPAGCEAAPRSASRFVVSCDAATSVGAAARTPRATGTRSGSAGRGATRSARAAAKRSSSDSGSESLRIEAE